MTANGGHPQMGRELKRWFLEAGFTEIRATGSFDYFDTAADVAFLHGFMVDWFFRSESMAAAARRGLATHRKFEQWRGEIDQWREAPGAVGGIAFGEAIGVKA